MSPKQSRMTSKPGRLIAAMVLFLVLAYILDRLVGSARNVATARLGVSAYQWLVMAADLAFAAAVIGLAWLMFRLRPQGVVRGFFLLVGLVLILLPTPPFWQLTAGLPADMVPILRASPHSFVGLAGAVLAVLGVAGVVWPGTR